MRFAIMGIAASAFALTACGGPQSAEDPSDPEQVAEVAAGLATPQPGQYRTTGELVEFDMPGAPEEQVQMMRGMMEMNTGQEEVICITEEQADEGFQEFLVAMNDNADTCTFSEFTVDGDQLNAAMQCDDGRGSMGSVSFDGIITETSQDMTVTMDMENAAEGQGIRMVVRNQTERLGDCPA
ncbi:DUF3617 domain-containing protein [Aurantiacibacter sediminis]|uniref:DUF3617 domain-containing protein n=1 Tax=Aurantiacibacter sediminis TaxID=2793064 RepID=A0ABS0N259_9SPHN|nr:DUF3617 domain-containing protein [Aurantiacibacter sediminis]MBH5322039.1 DUF3617 domain-containing protein [Aurantiacibacter sediminis]